MNKDLMFSSNKNTWCTPTDFFDNLNKRFNFTLDPCCTKKSALCKNFYTEKENWLLQDWSWRIFCNPPYWREIKMWIKKASEEIKKDYCEIIILLIPARTDTIYFHDYIYKKNNVTIDFIKWRLKFIDLENMNNKSSAPFPSMLITFNKMKKEISFNSKNHTYKNIETWEKYKSVSSIIAKFKPFFDMNKWSKHIAKKEWVEQEVIIKRWRAKALLSCLKWTFIHKQIEKFLNKKEINNDNLDEQKTEWYKDSLKYIEHIKKWNLNSSNIEFQTERMVYNHEYKIAWSIDLVILNGQNNAISIIDWKTNQKIKLKNYYKETLKNPLTHLDNCEYAVYSLQLSLYAFMLEKAWNKINKLTICHLTNWRLVSYKVRYRKEEVLKMLNYLK